jgi:hypothetical protein
MEVPSKYIDLAFDTLAELCETGDPDSRRVAAATLLDYVLASEERQGADEPAADGEEETGDVPEVGDG